MMAEDNDSGQSFCNNVGNNKIDIPKTKKWKQVLKNDKYNSNSGILFRNS